MTKLSGRSCRIYDDVRDSKILWDSLRKFDFGRQHSERVFPRTVDGSQQSYFDLPEFYGSSRMMDLWNWVYAIDDYFEEKNPPEQIQYQIAVYKLKGEARMWWENTLLEEADCDCDSGGKYQNPSWVMMRKLLICRYPHTTCLTKFRNQLNKEKGEEAPKHANCSTVCPIQSVNVKQEEIDVGGSSTGDESSKGRADSFMPSKCLTKCPNQVNEQKEAEMIKPVHVDEYMPAKCSTEVPYMPYIRKQEATDRDLRSLGESMEELEVVICGPDEGDYLVTEEIEDAHAMYEGLAFLFKSDHEDEELHLEQKNTVEIGAALQPYVLKRFVFLKEISGKDIQCSLKVPSVYVELMTSPPLAANKHDINTIAQVGSACSASCGVQKAMFLVKHTMDLDSVSLVCLTCGEYMYSLFSIPGFLSFCFDPGGSPIFQKIGNYLFPNCGILLKNEAANDQILFNSVHLKGEGGANESTFVIKRELISVLSGFKGSELVCIGTVVVKMDKDLNLNMVKWCFVILAYSTVSLFKQSTKKDRDDELGRTANSSGTVKVSPISNWSAKSNADSTMRVFESQLKVGYENGGSTVPSLVYGEHSLIAATFLLSSSRKNAQVHDSLKLFLTILKGLTMNSGISNVPNSIKGRVFCDIFESRIPEIIGDLFVIASTLLLRIDHDFTRMGYHLFVHFMGFPVCLITTLSTAAFFEIEIDQHLKNMGAFDVPYNYDQKVWQELEFVNGWAYVLKLALKVYSHGLINYGRDEHQLNLCNVTGVLMPTSVDPPYFLVKCQYGWAARMVRENAANSQIQCKTDLNKLHILVCVLSSLTPLLKEIGKKATYTIEQLFGMDYNRSDVGYLDAQEHVAIVGFGLMEQVLGNFLSDVLRFVFVKNFLPGSIDLPIKYILERFFPFDLGMSDYICLKNVKQGPGRLFGGAAASDLLCNLTRGRVIPWEDWNDVDNTNNEGFKKALKLFFKLVNGLDPPSDVMMSMRSLMWNFTVRSRTSFILFREMD